ncbi:MAG: helix-turn-helix domain-containing protein [Saonia sp.]
MKMTFNPSNELSDIVEYYWVIRHSPKELVKFGGLVLPSGSINLVFNLGAVHDLINVNSNCSNATVKNEPLLLGQKKTAVKISNAVNDIHLLGVRFFPNKLYRLTNIPMYKITELGVGIDQVLKRDVAKTEGILPSETTIQEKLVHIEHFLKMNLIPSKLPSSSNLEIDYAINSIKEKKGNLKIYELQKSMKMSRRALQYKFLDRVGVLPKEFARIVRINYVVELISKSTMSLTQIAHQANYSDQAHFIKEFKFFTKTTPRTFLCNNRCV